jgi:hypothetical protein
MFSPIQEVVLEGDSRCITSMKILYSEVSINDENNQRVIFFGFYA